jgi:hypothetical protein
VALAGLAVVVAAVAVVLWPKPPRVTWESFDRLHTGMSRPEVEAILGPPGNYTTSPPGAMGESIVQDAETGEQDAPGVTGLIWIAEAGIIEVNFDNVGQASRIVYSPLTPLNQNLLDNFLWRAKRQWHRWFP